MSIGYKLFELLHLTCLTTEKYAVIFPFKWTWHIGHESLRFRGKCATFFNARACLSNHIRKRPVARAFPDSATGRHAPVHQAERFIFNLLQQCKTKPAIHRRNSENP